MTKVIFRWRWFIDSNDKDYYRWKREQTTYKNITLQCVASTMKARNGSWQVHNSLRYTRLTEDSVLWVIPLSGWLFRTWYYGRCVYFKRHLLVGSPMFSKNRPIYELSDASNVWCCSRKASDFCLTISYITVATWSRNLMRAWFIRMEFSTDRIYRKSYDVWKG